MMMFPSNKILVRRCSNQESLERSSGLTQPLLCGHRFLKLQRWWICIYEIRLWLQVLQLQHPMRSFSGTIYILILKSRLPPPCTIIWSSWSCLSVLWSGIWWTVDTLSYLHYSWSSWDHQMQIFDLNAKYTQRYRNQLFFNLHMVVFK
ncbi:hypothetical protein Bca4012_083264 [Brassica carinata]